MPVLPIFDPARSGRHRWRGWIRPILVLSLLWFVLAGSSVSSGFIGVPAILGGAWLVRAGGWRSAISLKGLCRFLPWFIYRSVAGAVDVAVRALRPAMPLHPGLVERRLQLPEGAPRVALAQVVGMLPGTLSADLEDRRLVVHALDARQDIAAMVDDLEMRIAALFGIQLESQHAPGAHR